MISNDHLSCPTSAINMYPPPGSFRFDTPKPTKNGTTALCAIDASSPSDDVLWCWRRCLSAPIFKFRFWKIMVMVFLVVTTGYFSSIEVFRRVSEPQFVVNSSPRISLDFLKTGSESPFIYSQTIFSNWNNLTNIGSVKMKSSPNHVLSNLSPNSGKKLTSFGDAITVNRDSQNNPSTITSVDSNVKNSSGAVAKLNRKVTNSRPQKGTRERDTTSAVLQNINYPSLKLCPPIPPNLEGPIKPVLEKALSLEVLEKMHAELFPGGRFRPAECRARHKVAIIIPFRDRASHLAIFLQNLHPFLQKQQIDYTIYVIEQGGGGKFNRAMLMNIGSLEALKLYPYDCFIFHDVDLIPEDDRNLYTCPEHPRHMSVAINTMQYKLPNDYIFGGVSAMTVEQFKIVNGFSNKFWGWGGEDNDLSNRIKFHGFFITRYPANVARYAMIHHTKEIPNPQRYKILNEGKKKYLNEGLNTCKYKILDIQLRRLYTWVYVELHKL